MASVKVKQVIIKKTGRHKAVGLAYNDPKDSLAGTIMIDPRQSPLDFMDTAIHEKLHMIDPKLSEKKVSSMATDLAKYLWKLGYRKVSQ